MAAALLRIGAFVVKLVPIHLEDRYRVYSFKTTRTARPSGGTEDFFFYLGLG